MGKVWDVLKAHQLELGPLAHPKPSAAEAAGTVQYSSLATTIPASKEPKAPASATDLNDTLAENEREIISARTSAALQAAKARGKRLGNPKLSQARRYAEQYSLTRDGSNLGEFNTFSTKRNIVRRTSIGNLGYQIGLAKTRPRKAKNGAAVSVTA